MTKKWIKFFIRYGECPPIDELREWCSENCSGRYSIREVSSIYVSGLGFFKLKFQCEHDAVAFKLKFS